MKMSSLSILLSFLSLALLSSSAVSALCIGCGCQRNFRTCMNGVGACSVTINDVTYTDEQCCRDLRNDCHSCDGGLVCVRLSVSAPGELRDFFDVAAEEPALTDPFLPIIDDVRNGQGLTPTDFELIDDFPAEIPQGMTWSKLSHDAERGTDFVRCDPGAGAFGCDPWTGDTSCALKRPMLCIRQDGSPSPGGMRSKASWASGHIHATLPIQGIQLRSYDVASAMCAKSFGEGWRMVRSSDGAGGHGGALEAYGNVEDDTRFWVAAEQAEANCWN